MPTLRKATLVMSDHHLGEGMPKLEDFPKENERAYLEMLETHLELIGPDVDYRHVIDGDWFDYHAVRFEGRYGVVPTETAALAKTDAILRAHPRYFSDLRGLIERFPRFSLEMLIGNHDLDFAWASVQEKLRAVLAPAGQGQRVTFGREIPIGETALIVHGDQFDPFSANPPASDTFKEDVKISRKVIAFMLILSLLLASTLAGLIFAWVPYTVGGVALGVILSFVMLFLVFRWIAGHLAFQWSSKELVLNVPTASYMNAGLGTKLKGGLFPGIGRRVDHGDEWIIGVARKWHALPLLLPMLAMEAIGHKFFHAFRRPREKFNPRMMLDLIATTLHADRIEKELNVFLAERPQVRHLIAGHTHGGGMMTCEVAGAQVIYYNTGTAIRQVNASKPTVECRTRWTKLETFFRRIGYYWTHAPLKAAFVTAAYATLPVTLFLLPPLPFLHALRWPAAFLATFLLLWWQFAAEYKDGHFFRFTPAEVREYDDGSVDVRLLSYEPATKRFLRLTGEEAAWDHR